MYDSYYLTPSGFRGSQTEINLHGRDFQFSIRQPRTCKGAGYSPDNFGGLLQAYNGRQTFFGISDRRSALPCTKKDGEFFINLRFFLVDIGYLYPG